MTKKTEVLIRAVTLVNGGLKGVKVKYSAIEKKHNREYVNEYVSHKKAPIHTELEKTFNWLKGYLLDICGFGNSPEEIEILENDLEMTAVSYCDKGFTLSGKLAVLTGEKFLSITTPLISDSNEYGHFSKVTAILDGIYSETKDYMEGNKVMNDTELIIKFNRGKEDFDESELERMSPAEKKEAATKLLEDMGCIVLHNDDLNNDDDEEEIVVPEPPKKEVKVPAKEIKPTATQKVEFSKPTTTTTAIIEDDDDDFSLVLPMAEVKQSTAKRKTK